MFDLTGKKALVTGSTQGIGYAIARQLAVCGCEVTIHCSCDLEKAARIADSLAEQTGAVMHAVTADLADPSSAGYLFEKTGPVDLLICNASVQIRREWNEISADEYQRQTDVNLRSFLCLMQKYIPAMQRQHFGRVLGVGSVQQSRPHPQMAVYAATKCAMQSLCENIAKQTAADGVTVNMLLPGVISTPRNDEALSDPVYREQVLAKIPAGYAGDAEDCASAALLLCSEEGRYITGSALYVDGGMHL